MTTVRFAKMAGAFCSDEGGVTAIEYALLAALIFGAIVVSVGLLGDTVETLYGQIADEVSKAVP